MPKFANLEAVLHKSTIQLLRFHFSLFLLPVYLFAVGCLTAVDIADAVVIFIILHLLVYPASNGYNSYMDRDEGSIGGVENPLQPTKQLFYASIIMDAAAISLGLIVSIPFTICLVAYILASRAYSYRGIRLKKYPFLGYLTVMIFQGAVVYYMTYHGSNPVKAVDAPVLAMIASSLLIGGFYPLTQVYQHKADLKDEVKTISYKLGYKGTYIFTAIVYILAMAVMAQYFYRVDKPGNFFVLATILLPVLVYFFWWAGRVWKNTDEANFRNTMRMNFIAAICTNLAFITLLILQTFE
ncbi:MAG: prenyltransferase [Chitinophagaceae bacterium]|nr:MAG: prenyltransferase [Chitinophagaceae bacterium]